VVAEFTAGTATAGTGLAYRILESGFRLDIPRMYAALVLLSLAGIAIYAALSFVSWLVLHRWHESAMRRDL
jgi:NitT/TauT family transport system permease protein